MSGYEALRKFCGRCVHKEKCWRPCPVVLLAISGKKREGRRDMNEAL